MFWELLKALFLGIVEGVTEWLPISSTGHLILVDAFLKLDASDAFKEMFDVVIQLGAILAVVVIYWKNLWPFHKKETNPNPLTKTGFGACVQKNILQMWCKVLVACVPAAVVGLLFDDVFHALFYNPITVAIMLILFGVAFIVIERWQKTKQPRIHSIGGLDYKTVLLIGVFQLVAAVFPGTSRSGATIIGGLILGLSRQIAAEFTFYLAIPVMFVASLIKLLKFGVHYTALEAGVLAVGMISAFLVSVLVIRFLMGYIKKHDFKIFGWYRIVLGIVVLASFALFL